MDQGKVFVSRNFRVSCQFLGIDLQPAHPGSPTEKPHIEKMMSTVGTQFAQFASGYLGSSVERRGYRVEQSDGLWTLPQLQELLDEWTVGPTAGCGTRWHPGGRLRRMRSTRYW